MGTMPFLIFQLSTVLRLERTRRHSFLSRLFDQMWFGPICLATEFQDSRIQFPVETVAKGQKIRRQEFDEGSVENHTIGAAKWRVFLTFTRPLQILFLVKTSNVLAMGADSIRKAYIRPVRLFCDCHKLGEPGAEIVTKTHVTFQNHYLLMSLLVCISYSAIEIQDKTNFTLQEPTALEIHTGIASPQIGLIYLPTNLICQCIAPRWTTNFHLLFIKAVFYKIFLDILNTIFFVFRMSYNIYAIHLSR